MQFAVVTGNFFDVLGVRPALGRTLTAAEERPGTPPVALISHGLWQRRFAGAADAVGATLTLDGRAVQVVGVLPAGFSFLTFPAATDLWLPLGADPFDGRRFARGARSMGVLGRLKDGVTLSQARAEADGIAAGLAAKYPRFNTGRLFRLVPLRDQVVRGVKNRGAGPARGGVVRPADCVRERRQPAARACDDAPAGADDSRGARRVAPAPDQAPARGERASSPSRAAVPGFCWPCWLVDLLVTIPVSHRQPVHPVLGAEERDRRRHHRSGVHRGPHVRDGVPVRPRPRLDRLPSARDRRPPRRRPRHLGPPPAACARRAGRGRGRARAGAARHRRAHGPQLPPTAAGRSRFQPVRRAVARR